MMKIKKIEQAIVPETGWICLERVGDRVCIEQYQ